MRRKKACLFTAAVGSVLGLGVPMAHAQVLLYSFESGDSPNELDGFAHNGGGMTARSPPIGATKESQSTDLQTTGAPGGFVGALTIAPTQLATLDNPAIPPVSVDV